MTYSQPVPPAPAQPEGPVPLWAPLYGASLGAAVGRFFKKYADFTGRASRSEYWWFLLVDFLVVGILWALAFSLGLAGATTNADGTVAPGPGYWVAAVLVFAWTIGTLVPHLALIWRRLHDANFAGPWWFLSFIPFGSIVVLVFTLLPSNPIGSRFDRPRG